MQSILLVGITQITFNYQLHIIPIAGYLKLYKALPLPLAPHKPRY